jgi:ABC-type multidrug transport system ATPase subunit
MPKILLIKMERCQDEIAGYVQQEDLFLGTLTVEEHLRFQVDHSYSSTST